MRKTVAIITVFCGLTVAAAMATDGDGNKPVVDQVPWARWQGRLSLGGNAVAQLGSEHGIQRGGSASLVGDYYFFNRPLLGAGNLGGFRATSGLIFGPRSQLSIGQPNSSAGGTFSIGTRLFGQNAMPSNADTGSDTLPYLGVGYTNLSIRNGWSFSADLGLVAQSPGGLKAARNQSLDDAVRELRLAPLVQVGASYAF